MSDSEPPSPPDSLPKYIAEGLPKQDNDTLRDIQGFIDELLEYRDKSVEEVDISESAEIVDEDSSGQGTLVKETVTCGDDTCHCMKGRDEHGPYIYRYYYENGSLTSEYVRKA